MAKEQQEEEDQDGPKQRKRWAPSKDEAALTRIRVILDDLDDGQRDMVLMWVMKKWGKVDLSVSPSASVRATS